MWGSLSLPCLSRHDTDVPCKVNPLGVVEERPSRLGWVVF